MCGINLLLDLGGVPDLRKSINIMNKKISYRGPDGEGHLIEGDVAMGHKRLSILDLSENGRQPMHYKSFVIVYNGEIYNFKEIRRELRKTGHQFFTETDTEVILHAYDEWGEDCLQKFNGMFAFAIYNKTTGDIFAARDRAGIKPLVYSIVDGYFILSSELKAISCLDFISKKIDYNALNYYLSFGFIPAPFTIYKKVKKLEPGHYLKLNGRKIKIKKYWNPIKRIKICYKDAKKELENLVFDSVKKMLISDVPVGAFLSGGVDSAIITAVMSKYQKLNTFTIGYKNSILDESKYARITAKKVGSNHKTKFVTVDYLLKNMNKIISQLNEPFSDQSFIPTFVVSQETRKQFKVALAGDGADELFGGYNKYLALDYKRYNLLIKALRPLISSLPSARKNRLLEEIRKIKRLVSIVDNNLLNMAYNSMLVFDDEEKRKLVKFGKINCMKLITHFFRDETDPKNNVLVSDFFTILPNQMLFKVDSASMLNSLEVRVPFLDHRIVELVLNLPSDFKIIGGKRKRILKDSLGYLVDKKILSKEKRGFDIPIGEWLKKELKLEFLKSLESEDLNKLVDADEVRRIYSDFLKNRNENSNKLWSMYILSKWLEKNKVEI